MTKDKKWCVKAIGADVVVVTKGALLSPPPAVPLGRSAVAMAALMLVGIPVTYAQQSAGTPAQVAVALPTVTVSASGLQLGVNEMTTPTDVLAGDDLLWRQQGTLGETLAHEPGINSTHFGAGASRPIIRGMDGARVKVLSDGAQVQDASTVSPDHAVASEPLLATQIEVLRGPSALLYGGGAVGGVVNVMDAKVPVAIPAKGLEGSAQLRGSTAAREGAGAFSLTGGQGSLAVHVEGAVRDASDYRVGKGWIPEGQSLDKVPGSFNRTDTASVGVSWIGDRSYLGAAYTRQTAKYGLPGDSGGLYGECSIVDLRLQCPPLDPQASTALSADVPVVDLRSDRLDVRGEWRQPWDGIAVVRLRGGVTDYLHDELEDGAIGTRFKNKAHDLRLELQHEPIAGWKGVLGVQTTRRRFSAEGDEAYVQPTHTNTTGLFALEEYRIGNWRFEAAVRHDQQTAQALTSGIERSHSGTSASLGAVWRWMPGYSVGATLTRATRAPTAEELYANGLHLATRTYEQGNADLRSETSHNLDLTVRKTSGDTTWGVSVFRNQINNYIYGQTVDALHGLQWLQYTQADATFTGMEANFRQRLNRQWDVTVFGDMVRARLAGGGLLPRIPAARLGVRLHAQWQAWDGQVEWVQVARQNKITAFETATPSYGMLNAQVGYQSKMGNGTPWQVYAKANNITNRLAYAHTSFIKTQAPLTGRQLEVGIKIDF